MDTRRKQIYSWLYNGGSIRGGVDTPAGGDGVPAQSGTQAAGGGTGTANSGNTAAMPPPSNDELVTKWKELLPQDIRETPFIKETKSFTDLAIQAVNSQKMIGGRIPVPKDENDEKAWGEVYTKLGRPADVTGYKIERPANAADIGYSEGLEKSFLETGHKLGLNNKQANALIKWQADAVAASVAESKRIEAESMAQLKKDWGNNFDTRLSQVKRVVDEYEASYPGLVQALEKNNIGSNPAFVKFFFDVTEGMMEENEGGKGTGNSGGVVTPEQAQVEINKLMADKAFAGAFYNKRDPGHNAALDRIMELRSLMVVESA